jgi:hypothetical protein
MFSRGGKVLLVFDNAGPLDLSALAHDPVFTAASSASTEDASVITFPAPLAARLVLRNRADGWVVLAGSQPARLAPLAGDAEAGNMHIATGHAHNSITLHDTLTGAPLLVGTLKTAGEGTAVARCFAEFCMTRSVLGVVLTPFSDRVILSTTKAGFLIQAGRGPSLALADGKAGSLALPGSDFARIFTLPDIPLADLRQRLNANMLDAMRTPRLARGTARLNTAEAMLALGMGAEMEGVLELAHSEAPELAANPKYTALRQIAASLDQRAPPPGQEGIFDSQSFGGAEEASFWRALQSNSAPGARDLSWAWPLALNYPAPLRRIVCRRLADKLLEIGAYSSLRALAEGARTLPGLAGLLDYDEARAAQATGDNAAAARLLAAAARGHDRRDAARAGIAEIALGLQQHQIPLAVAASRGENLLYGFRTEAIEVPLRLQLATWHQNAGEWRAAFAALREGEAIYPSSAPQLAAAEHKIAQNLATNGAASHIPPYDLVALLDDYGDTLGGDAAPPALTRALADGLAALDLPQRAVPILKKMLSATSDPALRADLAERLAAATLELGDAASARAMLSESDIPGLPPALLARRRLTLARAAIQDGHAEEARATLRDADDSAGLKLHAHLAEDAHDWHDAIAALHRLLLPRLAGANILSDDDAETVLRLAADTVAIDDAPALARLNHDLGSRLAGPQAARLMQVISETPLAEPADLPRARQELNAASSASGDLAALNHP